MGLLELNTSASSISGWMNEWGEQQQKKEQELVASELTRKLCCLVFGNDCASIGRCSKGDCATEIGWLSTSTFFNNRIWWTRLWGRVDSTYGAPNEERCKEICKNANDLDINFNWAPNIRRQSYHDWGKSVHWISTSMHQGLIGFQCTHNTHLASASYGWAHSLTIPCTYHIARYEQSCCSWIPSLRYRILAPCATIE